MNKKLRLNIIGSACIMSIVIYYLVCYFLENDGYKPTGNIDQTTASILLGIFILVSASMAGLILFLKNIMNKKQLTDQEKLRFHILVFGLCDAPGVMGILMYMVTGKMLNFYILAGMSLLLFRIFWPRD